MTPLRWSRESLGPALSLYLVADPEQTRRDLVAATQAALAGGVTCVQLRAKRLGGSDFLALAKAIRTEAHAAGALFVINDRVDVAVAAGADGVHVGLSDLPLAEARRIVGPDLFIGYSPYTLEQVADSAAAGADYVGLGPVYATPSKADADPPIGIDGLAARVRATSLPTVGIGGITVENARDVIRAGADGIAVISAILRAPDPRVAASELAIAVARAQPRRHAGGGG
ncbi:MAG TPA: thiamine phosphate synthase [Thermomicrobiales bacterium]|nr:thiamine phosphate synthase [Thermomicrobiales bacterium]